MARGPLSNERLEVLPDGKVKLKLKTPWHDGTSHLLLTPSEFLEKLAAIVPPPRAHLVKWGGVFAPNSPLRRKVILKPGVKKAARHKQCAEIKAGKAGKDEKAAGDKKGSTLRGSSWARLLSRVFKVDVGRCQCGGELRVIAAICKPDEALRYLRYAGLASEPPARASPSYESVMLEFDNTADPAVETVLDLTPDLAPDLATQAADPGWD